MNEKLYWELYEQTLKVIRSDFPRMNLMDLEGIAGDAVVDMMNVNDTRASHCIRTAKARCLDWCKRADNNCESLQEAEYECDKTEAIAAAGELEKLNPKEKPIVALVALGFNREEISEILGINKSTIVRRLKRLSTRDEDYQGKIMWVESWYVWYKDSRRTRIMPEGYSSPLSEEYFDKELAKTIYQADAVMDAIVSVAKETRKSIDEVESVIKRRYNDGYFSEYMYDLNGKLVAMKRIDAEWLHSKVINGIQNNASFLPSESHT